MRSDYPKTLTAAFIAGYIFFNLGTLALATIIFSDVLASSWSLLGADAWNLKVVSLITPLVTAFAGIFAASVTISAAETRGSDRMVPWRFFRTGWISMILANMAVHCFGLRTFISVELGEQWLAYIGQARYNACVFLLAPTVGYAGAISVMIVLQKFIEAQKT